MSSVEGSGKSHPLQPQGTTPRDKDKSIPSSLSEKKTDQYSSSQFKTEKAYAGSQFKQTKSTLSQESTTASRFFSKLFGFGQNQSATKIKDNLTILMTKFVSLNQVKDKDVIPFLGLASKLREKELFLENIDQTKFSKQEILDISNLMTSLNSKVKEIVNENMEIFEAFVEKERRPENAFLQDYCDYLIDNTFEDALPFELDDEGFQQYDPSAFETSKVSQNVTGLTIPPGIRNVGNSCYRNAANQALLACRPLIAELRKPLEKIELLQNQGESLEAFSVRLDEAERNFNARNEIKKALVILVDKLENKAPAIEVETASRKLGEVISRSPLSSEFRQLFGQQDAAAYLNLILGNVLNYVYVEQSTYTALINQTSYSRAIPAEIKSMIEVPINGIETGGEREVNLQNLVDRVYDKTLQTQPWEYSNNLRASHYESSLQINGEPKEALVIQLKRGIKNDPRSSGAKVDKTAIKIPKDGIIDLSHAHRLPKGSIKYTIKSFIELDAVNGNYGHYLSYALKDGQWFCFNDSQVTRISEEEAKKKMADAYLYVLEKTS